MSNDFIPFAVGGSANVTAQATYAANTTLTQNGFQAGIAKSPDLNKVWRQSSIMSAVLAQFIVNQSGQNAVDDGTTTTLIANLLGAVQATVRSTASGVVGSTRNLSMNVTAASATATLTADEIIVETALGGVRYCLPSFSKTINLATTGAGGMDTGTAPVSGYVALYAIWNPTTQTAALLATNATAAVAPSVYGGANMPSGYTASALVSVWPTNSSSQFVIGNQVDRIISIIPVQVATGSSTTTSATPSSLSISTAVPRNARKISGYGSLTNPTAATNSQMQFSTQAGVSVGSRYFSFNSASTGGQVQSLFGLPVITPQTIYFSVITSGSSVSYTFAVSEYEI